VLNEQGTIRREIQARKYKQLCRRIRRKRINRIYWSGRLREKPGGVQKPDFPSSSGGGPWHSRRRGGLKAGGAIVFNLMLDHLDQLE
jgi:hypothetical protein